MKIFQLKESERIKESLRSLTEEFIEEYPYYSTWIEKNKATFKDRTRVVYELKDNEKTVGYMMVHFSTPKCVKVNGIYVFPDCQKRGYAKKALLQVLEELRKQNYDYAFIQTRTHNKIVVHMFDTLHFDVIGQNYHKIEKQPNWVAVYDLKKKETLMRCMLLQHSFIQVSPRIDMQLGKVSNDTLLFSKFCNIISK